MGAPADQGGGLTPPFSLLQDEQIDWEKPVLTQAEIEQKIKEYNSQINSNLFMSLVRPGAWRVCARAMGQGKELTASDSNSQKRGSAQNPFQGGHGSMSRSSLLPGAASRAHYRGHRDPILGVPCSQGLHPGPISCSLLHFPAPFPGSAQLILSLVLPPPRTKTAPTLASSRCS